MSISLQPGLPKDVRIQGLTFSQSRDLLAVAPQPCVPSTSQASVSLLPVYLVSNEPLDLAEPLDLLSEAFAVFASVPKLLGESDDDDELLERLCRILQTAIVTAVKHADQQDARTLSQLAVEHALFGLLPIVLSSEGLVGERLLDWLNTLDPAPSTDEGTNIVAHSEPWTLPNYWDYVVKAVLRGHLAPASTLVQELEKHSSETVSDYAQQTRSLLSDTPRSSQDRFRTERDYLNSRRTWLQRVKKLQADLDEDWDEDDDDEIVSIHSGLSLVVAIMSGDQQRLLDSVDDLLEAVACWGVWVNPSLRSLNLPSVVQLVSKSLPSDSTDIEQVVTRSMLESDWLKALQSAHSLSPFLSAHIVALLPEELRPRHATHEPLAHYFYRSYADCLPATFWKAKVAYLERAQDVPKAQAVLASASDSIEERIQVASSFGWERVVRDLCMVESQSAVERGEWGKALAYELRAGSHRARIERFARAVLEQYVDAGPEQFVHIVDSFPTSILAPSDPSQNDHNDDDEEEDVHPSLVFLARYRDFLALYAQGERVEASTLLIALLKSGVGSKFGFVPVMLLDSMPLLEPGLMTKDDCMELLRILEDVGLDERRDLDLVGRLAGSNEAARKQLRILRARIAQCIAQ